MDKILETERLVLRKLTQEDFTDLCKILKDKEVMYAYEHAFEDDEAHDWLDRQIMRYKNDGFGLWAVILKENGEFIGQCGITMQEWEEKEFRRWDIFSERNSGIRATPPKSLSPVKNMLLRSWVLRRFILL